ncbi:SMI1/KNR4 family protein [Myroides odoratimimus]|uniref:SMI1/KNR4 family protein n=1 Tax=Myroides odoratimimus TaxID=76832 RepID=UPI00091D0D64|nr:SMI1/KNR4 family protein [Myroides odoratimimus]SHL86921.1 SMI1 / KNR4 family (SUKH-1) [Myroides odoratimimus subsp. xuanwuensis]
MTITELEQKYNIVYPELYKQLEQDNMLEVGEYSPMWYATTFPKLKDNPPLLLFSDDFELTPLKDVDEDIAWLRDPDNYMEIKEEYNFISFAKNGAGDMYCFMMNEEVDGDYPIVYVWHDDIEATYEAKNLRDFIFKRIVMDMSQLDTYNNQSDQEFIENLRAILKTHIQYLSEDKVALLQELIERPIIDYRLEDTNDKYRGLLTYTEYKEILAKYIPYEKMNVSFPYSE